MREGQEEKHWVKLSNFFLSPEISTTAMIIGICKEIYHRQIDYLMFHSMLA